MAHLEQECAKGQFRGLKSLRKNGGNTLVMKRGIMPRIIAVKVPRFLTHAEDAEEPENVNDPCRNR